METIYYNGHIITMAAENGEEELNTMPEAVYIKNGMIFAMGKYDEIKKMATNRTRCVNLNGKCLMPSFIDSHSHAVMNGQMAMFADLSECKSFQDIEIVLKEYIKKKHITRKHAVLGFGYDHNFLIEGTHPDKRVLDKVSLEIPIFVLHISAHLACANSVALRMAGIDDKTQNPSGGKIGRIQGSDEPDGYLEEAGMTMVQSAISTKLKLDLKTILQGIQKIYMENGITTIQDGATTTRDFAVLKILSALKLLKVDVVSYPLLSAGGEQILRGSSKRVKRYIRRLKIGGYKLILDGSPQGRSAWMSEPYLGEEQSYCGYPWMETKEVEKYIKQAVEDEQQLLVHCNGDAASEQFLTVYEKVLREKNVSRCLRPVMIHCQTVRNDQLDRMSKLGMIASVFVGHVWYWGDVHKKNLGEERGNHISPVRDAIDRNVIVNFHQDTPITKPDMLHSIWCAVNRISRGGQVIGKEQKVSVYEAMKAVTINVAYQYFEENLKGTLEVGKCADLVILDKSPLEVEVTEIKNIKVLETIKDGKCIYCRK